MGHALASDRAQGDTLESPFQHSFTALRAECIAFSLAIIEDNRLLREGLSDILGEHSDLAVGLVAPVERAWLPDRVHSHGVVSRALRGSRVGEIGARSPGAGPVDLINYASDIVGQGRIQWHEGSRPRLHVVARAGVRLD